MNFIDRFLNRITMYRLVLYYLMILVVIAAIFGAVGLLPYSPLNVLGTALILVVLAWAANTLLGLLFKAHPNVESGYITALILALIITPQSPLSLSFVLFLLWATLFAAASKYVLSIDKKHLFNPAAIAVAITALAMGMGASWWVGGNLPLMAFVIIGGLLIVRRIQRFDLSLSFLLAALASDILTHPTADPFSTIQKAVLHTPIFFFAAIMITEPLTTPPTRMWRIQYGALVGLLFSPLIHIGSIYSTPELALLVGNVFSFIVSPKGKHVLSLIRKEEVGGGIWNFWFAPEKNHKVRFTPGQYLEWTLGHIKPDDRGNRRYFTIASSPTESELLLGVRFPIPSSSFKERLLTLKPGDTIVAGHLAGDFTLSNDVTHKLVFIAGGIGITPFRSMIKNITDTGAKRDVALFYSNRNKGEIAYADVFDEAATAYGLKTIYAITGEASLPEEPKAALHPTTPKQGIFVTGRINADLIRTHLPDYADRFFYVSGTLSMVNGMKEILADLGIPRTHITTDFFPGF